MIRRAAPVLAILIAAIALPSQAAGFSYGVAAGEVKAKSAMLWARADSSGKVRLRVADNRRLRGGKTRTITAVGDNDNTVQATIKRLKPDTLYYYRFQQGSERSELGRFRTAPGAKKRETIEFAFSGDADAQPDPNTGQPAYNNFEVYGEMASEGNHFNVNLGDTIYSDTEVGARFENGQFISPDPALTVAEKWAKYRQNLALDPLQRMRGTSASYSHWDDHEFINDFSLEEHGREIYTAGVKAFRDYSPVTYTPQRGLYRKFRWGRNVETFFLDERSFRDAKASAGGTCDNPESRQPDLAPTAPRRLRQAFAAFFTSFNSDPPPECIARINDPSRDFLGQAQYNRLTSAINDSNATWKVIFSEVPMQQFYALPYDRWEGYEAERQKLLSFLDKKRNVVVLSTDNHANYYNNVRFKTLDEDPAFQPQNSNVFEMVTGPVATLTQKREADELCESCENAGDLVTTFYRTPPPNGPGMECAATDVYSYSQVRVTRTRLTITPKDLNGQPVRDSDGGPCGPFTLNAE